MIKMLVADDERMIREGIVGIVDWSEHGIAVVGAAVDGVQALEMYRAAQPDIVVTDIRMPKLEGLELLRGIREDGRDVQVIILSGYEDFKYAQEAIRLGASEYLLKPVMPDSLVAAVLGVKEELKRRRRQREETDRLRAQAEESRPALKMALLRDLATGHWPRGGESSESSMSSESSDYLLLPFSTADECWVAAIVLEGMELEAAASERQRQLNYYQVCRTLNAAAATFDGEAFHLQEGQYGLVLRNADAPSLARLSAELRERLEAEYGVSSAIGIRSIGRGLEGLREAYATAKRDASVQGGGAGGAAAGGGSGSWTGSALAGGESESGVERWLEATLAYLREHYDEPLSLKKLADVAYLSPNYVCSLFKDAMGQNISDYLAELRVEKAKELLGEHGIKAYEVAQRVGYSDSRYFNRLFKRYTGYNLSEYRARPR